MLVLNNRLHDEINLPNELACPYCNAKVNTATSHELSELQDGDFGLCVGCYQITICVVPAVGAQSLRKPTEVEIFLAKRSGLYAELMKCQDMLKNTNHGLKVKK